MSCQRLFRPLVLVIAAALAAAPSGGLRAQDQQQLPGGIEVSPDGVLHRRTVHDRSGRLARERIAAAKARLDPDLARPSRLRKVSLSRLEAAVARRIADGQQPTDAMKYLAGLTRIRCVFFYPETGDLVIAGPAEGFVVSPAGRVVGMVSGRSVLELQDLVTALRAFPPAGPPTSAVTVSIDPTREGLARMQQFLVSISGRITPRDAKRIAAGLRERLGLQTVTITGISPKTHFAQVLVEADYRMKLIGIGLEKPPVKILSYVQRASPHSVARNALQRWYFTPNYQCVRVSEDQLAVELVGDGVQLITQQQRVTADGGRVNGAHADRASQAFVTSFTKKYAELSRKLPVYAQLRNLIDLLIAAAFIQQQDYYSQANWAMAVFGDEGRFPVETYQAPRYAETAVNVVWKGNTLMTPIGGGVHINPRRALAPDRLLPDENGQLQELRRQTTLDQLPPDRWWWD